MYKGSTYSYANGWGYRSRNFNLLNGSTTIQIHNKLNGVISMKAHNNHNLSMEIDISTPTVEKPILVVLSKEGEV